MTSASEKSVKPEDCGLAFGLPLTEDEVRSGLEESSAKHWVKHFSACYGNPQPERLWPDYYVREVAAPASQLIQTVKKMGVTVYRNCSLAQLSGIAERHSVLTLVSHWIEDEAIELSDGVHPVDLVASAFPAGYKKVLDLMICQSIRLADAIKRRFPDCACLCNSKPTRLKPKLFLYGQTQVTLKQRAMSYPDAVFATYRQFLRRENR